MKRALVLLALMLAAPFSAGAERVNLLSASDFQDWYYQNPSEISDVGDPFILYADGAYWCLATSSPIGYCAWRSEDLANWEKQQQLAYKVDFDSWSRGTFWAPEVYFYQGRYCLFYSATGEGVDGMRIGAAVSDSSGGPYKDVSPRPLFDPGYSAIDASFFVDGDGQPYLYYARDCSENVVNGVHVSQIYGVKLKRDLTGVDGEPVLLATPDQSWEMASGPDWLWNEGPNLVKQGGKYWLFYSANYYAGKEYGVGVASADGPLGPFVKMDWNPVLSYVEQGGQTLVSGPGHNSFFTAPGGETFTAYHTHRFPYAPSDYRQMALDRAGFRADGTPYVNGPTLAPQLKPLAQLNLKNLLPGAEGPAEAACLTDGDYGICPGPETGRAFQGRAEFCWREPANLCALVLYPEKGAAGKGRIVLNGKMTIDFDLKDLDTRPGASLNFHFDPIRVTSLEIRSEGALCEVRALGAS